MKETRYSLEIEKEMKGLDFDDLSYISFGSAFAHKMLYGEVEKDSEVMDQLILEAIRDWKEYKQFSLLMKFLNKKYS